MGIDKQPIQYVGPTPWRKRGKEAIYAWTNFATARIQAAVLVKPFAMVLRWISAHSSSGMRIARMGVVPLSRGRPLRALGFFWGMGVELLLFGLGPTSEVLGV